MESFKKHGAGDRGKTGDRTDGHIDAAHDDDHHLGD